METLPVCTQLTIMTEAPHPSPLVDTEFRRSGQELVFSDQDRTRGCMVLIRQQ